jgi:spore maturation protein SpmA
MQKLSKPALFKQAKQYVSIILLLFKTVILFVALVNPALAYQMGVVLQIIQLVVKIAEFLIEDFQSRRTSR